MSEPAPDPVDPLDSWFEAGLGEALHQEPLAVLPARAADERYRLLGELGRGGMGIVTRGRDHVLSRDVAVKLLHDRHCGNAEFVRRFVEEAQICGQLQHPGIVPIYDLGNTGGRPFFAMKLIEGHTLAALLGRRKSLAEDRTRFLRIFEQVCLTMAFAHSRGVLHRDLKPKNIMVGAFGEVQIMDWGLAKLLAGRHAGTETVTRRDPDADSRPGATLGTLSYMPPEQAIGDGAHVDERADVFALGATLCEILTGTPAYSGADSAMAALAQSGDTTEAITKLEQSDASPELIALAKHCLSNDVAARPRDAGRVAERITTHLAEVERRAEESRIRVISARRTQRLTIALAAAIVAMLALAGSGWLLHVRDEDHHAAETQFRQELAECRDVRSQARSQYALWDKVEQKCTNALRAGKMAGLPAEVLGLGESERLQIVSERKDAVARRALEVIRIPQNHCLTLGSGSNREARRPHREYARAFAAYGIDVLAREASPASLGDAIAASTVSPILVAALDDWAIRMLTIVHSGCQLGDDEPWGELAVRLLEVSAYVDGDPLRNGIRKALQDLDASDQSLPNMATPLPTDPEAAMLLVAGLRSRRCEPQVVAVLESLESRHDLVDALWVQFRLGLAYETLTAPDWSKAVEHYHHALSQAKMGARHLIVPITAHLAYAIAKAGNPESASDLLKKAMDDSEPEDGAIRASALNVQGLILFEAHRLEDSLLQFDKVNQRECTTACPNLSRLLFDMGRPDDAAKLLKGLGEGAAKMAAAHKLLGDIHALDRATLADAVNEYRYALRLQPDFGAADYGLALVLRAMGENGDARRELERAERSGYRSPERWEEMLRSELDALGAAAATSPQALPALNSGRFAEAVRIYGDAPPAPLSPQSWDFTRALLLAASTKDTGTRVSEEQRATWRDAARERLRRELAILVATRSPGHAGAARVEAHLRRWRREPCIAEVIQSARFAALGETARQAWLTLANDIEVALDERGH